MQNEANFRFPRFRILSKGKTINITESEFFLNKKSCKNAEIAPSFITIPSELFGK